MSRHKMANKLKYLVIHCTATPAGRNVSADTVRGWHKARGWDRPGYRTLILLDGKAERLVGADRDDVVDPNEITWGVGPKINPFAHHICYVGGTDAQGQAEDTRTDAQKKTLEAIVRDYLTFAPEVQIAGHNQFSNKACPSFWVPKWLRELEIPEKNICQDDPFGYSRFAF